MDTNTTAEVAAATASNISQAGIIIIFILCALTIIGAFVYAAWLAKWVRAQKNENKEIERIAGLIRSGADAFMRKEYLILAVFAGVVAVLIFLFLPGPVWKQANINSNLTMALCYIAGTVFSAIAGKIGIYRSSLVTRTAEAATHGIAPAFRIGFRGGSVMGLLVVGPACWA